MKIPNKIKNIPRKKNPKEDSIEKTFKEEKEKKFQKRNGKKQNNRECIDYW